MNSLPEERLEALILLASEHEAHLSAYRKTPLQIVSFGTLVRVRRHAEAVRRLGPAYGYEARVQVRTLLELYFNYAWIRLKQPRSRAIRFLRFQPLEKLKVAEELARASEERARFLEPHIQRLRRRRRDLRHLFRQKVSGSNYRWAKDWAGGLSFEARLNQVLADSSGSSHSRDTFLYALYRWFSSAVHGGPQSFEDVLTRDSDGVRVKSSEEISSFQEIDAAGAILLGTWNLAAEDYRLSRAIKKELRQRFHDLLHDLRNEIPRSEGDQP